MRTVIYNTDMVKGDDIPTKYEDLLDPKWQGKIAGPAVGGAMATALAPVLGDDGGAEWVDEMLNRQKFVTISKLTDIPSRVANGEYPIGFGLSANYAGHVDKGAPLANAPIEKVAGLPYYQFVVEGAKHPNASALLTYFFCCTDEGRQTLNRDLHWSLHDTVGSEAYEIGGDGRAVIPSAEWQLNDMSAVIKRYDALLGR
jgi:iron(III) transport system substrate-binding protein